MEDIELNLKPATDIDVAMNKWFSDIEKTMNKHIPKRKYKTLSHPKATDNIRRIHIHNTHLLQEADPKNWTPRQRERPKQLRDCYKRSV